jgi:hypothetical protein
METGFPKSVATLVAFADGSTSLYFSNGGGVIGAGEHESVRRAADELLSSAEQHIALFVPANRTPLPGLGRVCFYVHSFGGIQTAEAAEDDLGYGRHPLSNVFHSAQGVITAIRETTDLGR